MGLSGSLAEFPLERVLRFLESTGKTGVLEIAGTEGSGALEVHNGSLTSARFAGETGETALGAAFSMVGGEFAFHPGEIGAPNLTGALLDELIARAVAAREEMTAIRALIPDDRVRFALSQRAAGGGQITVSAVQWRVLLMVNGKPEPDVAEVVARCNMGVGEALKHLHALVSQGLVDVLPAATPETVPAAAAAVPEAARAAVAPPAGPAPIEARAARPVAAVEPPPSRTYERPPAAPEPVAAAEADTEDMAAALDARLAVLSQPPAPAAAPAPASAPPRRATAPGSPDDFWSAQIAAKEAATPSDITTMVQPEPAAAAQAAPRRPVAPVEPPEVSHYLPVDATAPILEADVPPSRAEEKKKRGLFGRFGGGAEKKKEKARAATSEMPARGAAPSASARATATRSAGASPGRLASFANALLAEYNAGGYGRGKIDERMGIRLRLVDEMADPLERMLPLTDNRLDVTAIDGGGFEYDAARSYLAWLIFQIYQDAERVFGRDKAKRGFKVAVQLALGGDESILRDPAVSSVLPKL